MSNYNLNNVRRFIFHIDEHDYWDMNLNTDQPIGKALDEDCLILEIDPSNPLCIEGDTISSLPDYLYPNACKNGLKLENIGYTGVDNGLIHYRKDRISNDDFYKLYTDSSYEVESGDTRLHLHKLQGNTGLYDYPTSINEDGSIKLNGGFYQGFFRSGNEYSVLPSRIESGKEWNLSFDIRKQDYEPESNKTLNDAHPDNKGIFFYIGTRAENKWIYLYDNIPMSGNSADNCDMEEDLFDLFCEDMVLSAQTFDTKSGFDIGSANDAYILSDNKFLIFSRACGGVTVKDYSGDEVAMIEYKTRKFDGNLFLYMNHSCSGYTVHNIDQIESGSKDTYDDNTFYSDIYNNALAFIINDDGSVGYRYLTKDCNKEHGYGIMSGNSYPGLVQTGEWTNIRVRIKASKDKMKLMFYVNGKLKYITKEMPALDLKQLDELKEKQEGVAYNISLGGGTQGLSETIMPDYMLNPTRIFPLEENFAGTFIGDIRGFKFYAC
jgi:hypothetical protein